MKWILAVIVYASVALGSPTQDLDQIWGCADRHFQFWQKIRQPLLQQVNQNPNLSLNEYKKITLSSVQAAQPLLQFIFVYLPQQKDVRSIWDLYQAVVALDVGDQSTDLKKQRLLQWQDLWVEFDKKWPPGLQACSHPVQDQTEPDPEVDGVAADKKALLGGQRALVTAYQSCPVLELPAMTASTPDVVGISVVGTHPDGVGSKREISILADVQRTHYYIQALARKAVSGAGSDSGACFNVFENPLIYDYGGKPFVSADDDSILDFFRNAGDGTEVLGIDCSGFIFSSLATAGLRLQKNRPLKAADVIAWGSAAYVQPEANGLSCLKRVAVGKPSAAGAGLKAGDLVAVYGHVLMIYQVGSDPWGLKSVSEESACDQLNEDGFDFSVLQSSNSKNGLGINVFVAKDYLKTSDKMREGFLQYGRDFCRAKFKDKTWVPKFENVSLTRHSGEPECLGRRVLLSKESCVSKCFNRSSPAL
ncbi:MAG: hypothetical protein ACOYOK_01645 [Pseudobdellovibrionaceae bacterium]